MWGIGGIHRDDDGSLKRCKPKACAVVFLYELRTDVMMTFSRWACSVVLLWLSVLCTDFLYALFYAIDTAVDTLQLILFFPFLIVRRDGRNSCLLSLRSRALWHNVICSTRKNVKMMYTSVQSKRCNFAPSIACIALNSHALFQRINLLARVHTPGGRQKPDENLYKNAF